MREASCAEFRSDGVLPDGLGAGAGAGAGVGVAEADSGVIGSMGGGVQF